ncbi:Uncharacterized protein dnm_002990 [Desulfonema magnum]|uniref:Uncharacterized protein n=1 Tax=Desulfonema magnum TaxID=45655 RepID=A0A975BFF2_9BACT|nr:Uncharacterized protein dnm_002990 [Desulfonema magnum]
MFFLKRFDIIIFFIYKKFIKLSCNDKDIRQVWIQKSNYYLLLLSFGSSNFT